MGKTFKIFAFFTVVLTVSSAYSQNLKLISPAGGENWEANSTQTITWQSSGVEKIKIEFSLNNGMHWLIIADDIAADLGKYSWKIPNSQTSDIMIRIADISNLSVYNITSKQFSIYLKDEPEQPRSLKKEAETASAAVKIMPLGDSITEGEGDDIEDNNPIYNLKRVGYREELFNLLTFAGYNFRFVGNKITGYDTFSPPPNTDFYNYGRYNEGHGGWVADGAFPAGKGSIEDDVNDWLSNLGSSNLPDIILLHTGTNDYYIDPPSTIHTDIRNVLNKIEGFNSNIMTILSSLIYYSHLDRASLSDQEEFNELLETEVINLINSGKNYSFVDMNSVLSQDHYPSFYSLHQGGFPDDFRDIHPNNLGYSRMAQAWFTKLQSTLPILQLKVFLQGPFDININKMTTSLNTIIPKISPYVSAPVTVNYTIPSDVTDWILIEIRNTDNVLVKSKSCFLRDDGVVLDPDGLTDNIYLGIPPSSYHLVVKHRNHLGIMSSDVVELNGLTSYDFTTAENKAYTTGPNPMVNLSGGKFGMYSGDGNSSGFITASDNNLIWLPQNGSSGYFSGDYNMSGQVSAADNDSYWLVNNGKASQIP